MATPQSLDTSTFKTDLAQFTGSETWHRHALNRNVTLTDGALFFADQAGAHWLMDIFATELTSLVAKRGFVSVTAHVANRKADLVSDDGNGNVLWRKHIAFTDCPEGQWEFYMAPGGPANTIVIMLTSEY